MARRVITEAEVLKSSPSTEFVVDRDTIITPAAIDAAFAKGIPVLYRRGTEVASALWRMDATAGKIAGLPDGDYLLQMRNGRVRVLQIRDDGVRPAPGF